MFPTRTELETIKINSNIPENWVEISIDSGKKKSIGIVRDILTKAETHPHGIMVRIDNLSRAGLRTEKGRVERFLSEEEVVDCLMSLSPNAHLYDGIPRTLNNLGKYAEKRPKIVNESTNNQEENLVTEFKSTFKFDTKLEILKKQGKNEEAKGRKKDEGKIQHALKKEISIAIAAFANTDGGQLIIGKNDEGEISEYFENDKKMYKNWDAYTLAIINSIEEFTKNRPFVSQIRLVPDEDKKFLTLNVPKSTLEPIIIYDKGQEEFYIRAVVGKSQKLQPSEMINYCKINFSQWIGKRR